MSEKETNWKPVNMWVAVPVIMQIAIVAQMLWGGFGDAWDWSWICSWCGVILCLELMFYNAYVKKGLHPIKSLYPIVLMLGFGFWGIMAFAFRVWPVSWWGLVAAAIGCGIVYLFDRKITKA
jgi:hypothetical protein